MSKEKEEAEKEKKKKKKPTYPPEGISFEMPDGKWITAYPKADPEENRAVYEAFWAAWARVGQYKRKR